MKRWGIGVCSSIFIIFFSLVSGISYSNGWTIGDYIFKFFDIPPWSNGSTGIHYSTIVTLIFLMVGFVLLTASLESSPNKFAKRLKVIILIAVLCWPFFISAGEHLIMSFSTGVNAIEYDRGGSTCNFMVGDDGGILVTGSLCLTNHGKEPVTFYMKIKPNSHNDVFKAFFGDGLVLRNKDNEFETFVLKPKEVRTFDIESYAINSSNSQMSLSISSPTVVLFNDQGEKTFAR